jgi:O-succinylbenzoic acid--CoA ligase
MLNFEDYKKSFLKDLYHFENDIFCIFDTQNYNSETLSALCSKAREYVTHGFIFQTSGSTANKKFVLHDFESIKASALNINLWTKVNAEDIFLAPISIHHMGGFSVLSRSFFAGARPSLILKAWSLAEFLSHIDEHSVTCTSLVPSLVYEIVQAKVIAPKSLKAVFVGGSGLSVDLFEQAIKLGWPLLKTFGSSEACSQIFTQVSLKDHVQMALPHWQIKVSSDQRLQIKGLSLYRGYLILKQGQIKFAEVPRDDGGFFTTEDMVTLEGRKLKSFIGRINDFVKINSTLIHLEALRQRFYQFCLQIDLDPNKILLKPKEDLKTGLQIVAVAEGPLQNLAEKLNPWNQQNSAPERIKSIYYVEKIPRSELGKPKYNLLP